MHARVRRLSRNDHELDPQPQLLPIPRSHPLPRRHLRPLTLALARTSCTSREEEEEEEEFDLDHEFALEDDDELDEEAHLGYDMYDTDKRAAGAHAGSCAGASTAFVSQRVLVEIDGEHVPHAHARAHT